MQANSVRVAAAAVIAEYAEFGRARLGLEQGAETDYEMHLDWVREHPGRPPDDRAYYLMEMTSSVDIPEPLLRKAEDDIIDWIGSTYNDGGAVEVPWASHAGTGLQALDDTATELHRRNPSPVITGSGRSGSGRGEHQV
ncbi:hypothetical protein [Nocardia sp. X0981]